MNFLPRQFSLGCQRDASQHFDDNAKSDDSPDIMACLKAIESNDRHRVFVCIPASQLSVTMLFYSTWNKLCDPPDDNDTSRSLYMLHVVSPAMESGTRTDRAIRIIQKLGWRFRFDSEELILELMGSSWPQGKLSLAQRTTRTRMHHEFNGDNPRTWVSFSLIPSHRHLQCRRQPIPNRVERTIWRYA